MTRARRRGLRALLSVTVLLGTIAPRLALCVGTGDHRALEFVGAACCLPASTGLDSLSGGCASHCTDTPLQTSAAIPCRYDHLAVRVGDHRGHTVGDLSVSSAPAAVSAPALPVSTSGWGNLQSCSPRLRATVLRC